MREDKYKQNAEWIVKAQKGDEKAMEALIVNNAGLVNSIAAKFLGRGTDYEDLVQIGNIGLLKAIRSFDLGRECAFSTYAVPLIFGEIRRFLRDDGSVKVSRTQKRLGAILVAEREKNGPYTGFYQCFKRINYNLFIFFIGYTKPFILCFKNFHCCFSRLDHLINNCRK